MFTWHIIKFHMNLKTRRFNKLETQTFRYGPGTDSATIVELCSIFIRKYTARRSYN